MLEVYKTDVFMRWLGRLRDKKGRAIIDRRLDALELGHFGDSQQVAKDVIEMRAFTSVPAIGCI